MKVAGVVVVGYLENLIILHLIRKTETYLISECDQIIVECLTSNQLVGVRVPPDTQKNPLVLGCFYIHHFVFTP